MSEYRLEMRGVCKSFPGVKALDHAQLCLRPGKVHALMGENGAGKSTLMKCMFGIYSMDEGEIIYEGQKVDIKNPLEALKMGIAMVHQELQPIPARTVGENIFLGRYPMKKFLGFIPVVDHEKMYADTERVLKEVRMNFDPKQRLGELLPMPVYPVPSNTYMGIHVTNTIDGNVTVGPNAELVTDFTNYAVPQKNMDYLAESASRLWPHIHKKDYIRNYSGILPKWVDENGVIRSCKLDSVPATVNFDAAGQIVTDLNTVIDTVLNLPKIPGGKKLIYNHLDLPLTAIADFEEAGKTDPLFAELDRLCKANNGLWNPEAEAYLLANAKAI